MKKKQETFDDSFLQIREHALDEEWVGQPQLYFKYAMELADARRDLDEAKSELDVVRAELDRDIRLDPETYHCPKLVETSIANCILLQDNYIKATETVNKAQHLVNMLMAVTIALDHRKRALENLVVLHGQSYFASPKAKRGSEEEELLTKAEKRSIRSKGRRREE